MLVKTGTSPSSTMDQTASPTPDTTQRIFLLSPASCTGKRARQVVSDNAWFNLARELRGKTGAELGDVFSFCSALYFRGKLAYARRFARTPGSSDPRVGGGILVITPNAGLLAADASVTRDTFRAFATDSIDVGNLGYRRPLEQGARTLLALVGPDCEVVLLGSIASGKYVDVLLPFFGDRLLFPTQFVGRGDMSRGGLMLRAVDSGHELEYAPVAMAVRTGQRPPRLERMATPRRLRP
jgi:hypothetical protein